MRINRLRLRNFRGVESFTLEPRPTGVTVVEGPNEAGKTSIVEALRLLFQESIKDSSSATAVRRIKPVGRDVATEIELELELGGRTVTFSRRFHRDRMTELRVTGAAPLTADEAHDAFHRLLHERLDRALWDALWVQQGNGLDQAALSTSRVLRDALDSASQPSGPRDESLVERIRGEYRRYFTEGRASESGELRDARRARDEALATLEQHRQRLAGVEARLDAAGSLERQLADACTALPARESAAESAARAVAELASRESELKRLEALAGEAAAALRELRAAAERREQTASAIDRLRGAIENQEQAVARAQADLEEATRRHEQAEAAASEAVQAARDAAAARTLAEADYGHLNDVLQLSQMRARSARVAANTTALETARSRLAELPVTGDVLARLRQLHLDAVAAGAARESAATVVEIAPAHNLDIVVDGQPRSFPAGRPTRITVTSAATFTLPGLLGFTVHPAAGAAGASAKAGAAHDAFESALRDLGVVTIDEAQAIASERAEVERALRELPGVIQADLADLDAAELAARITRQEQRVASYRERRAPDPPLPADTTSARAARDEATRTDGDATARERDAARARDEAARYLGDTNTRLVEATTRLESSRVSLGAESDRLAELDSGNASAPEDLAVAVTAANQRQAELKSARDELAALRPEALQRARSEADAALAETRDRVRTLELDLAGARSAVDEGTRIQADLDEAARRAETACAAFERTERRARAAARLYRAVSDARTATQSRLAEPLRERLQDLGRRLYGDSFGVTIGRDLTISERTLDGIPIDFDQLSAGAREQLTILARVATAMLVDPQEGVPLIIDDALGYTDPERLRGMGEVLQLAGEHGQVIVLTCDPARYAHVAGATVISLRG